MTTHIKNSNISLKINDKSNFVTRFFGLLILILESLKGNRKYKKIEMDELVLDQDLFNTELSCKGASVVDNFIPEKDASILGKELIRILSMHYKDINLDDNIYENEKFLIQKGAQKLHTYGDLQNYSKTVFHIRDTAEDKGFIDIFNVDLLFDTEPYFNEVLKCLDRINIENILKKVTGNNLKRSNLNVYITPKIEKTRSLHIDSLNADTKVFVYLSDVSNTEKGPYGYVLGSHKYKLFYYVWMKIYSLLPTSLKSNLRITDCVFFKTKDAQFFTGKPGTMICTLQNGSHRGHPQLSDDTRVVLVAHYE